MVKSGLDSRRAYSIGLPRPLRQPKALSLNPVHAALAAGNYDAAGVDRATSVTGPRDHIEEIRCASLTAVGHNVALKLTALATCFRQNARQRHGKSAGE